MSSVVVTCRNEGCGRDFLIPHARLRELIDLGAKPTCQVCSRPKSAPARTYGPARLADVVLSALARHAGDGLVDEDVWTVWAWTAAPARLGMRGFAYPDKKRVYREILLLVNGGYVERVPPRRYTLTELGRVVVAKWQLAKAV